MISKKTFREMEKFLAVGGINTLVDFGSLNLMSFVFKIDSGLGIIILNIIAFSFAVINSYFFNKFWTFDKEGSFPNREIAFFLSVNFLSGIINTAVVYFGTTFFSYPGFTDMVWLNFIKICASIFSAGINFFGYKFIVFSKK